MKLTQYTDYSLRVLMYLAQQKKQSQIEEIANFYG
ncbi:Rrf2 family transcriptional regulator, partial [Gemella sp. 19428wG2_WT2a]